MFEVIAADSAETQTESGEQGFRSLFTSAPAMLHSLDAEGNIGSVSDLWLRSLGYRREEVVGRPATDFLTAESARITLEECLPRFLASGRLDAEPLQFVKKNGEVMDALVSAVGVRDADGGIVRSISVVTDVTERLRAERRARRLHEQLSAALVELSQAEQHERQRIASELHDRVGQSLAIARMKLAKLQDGAESAAPGAGLAEVGAALDAALADTRTLTYEISPPILYEVGLEPALEWLARQFRERHSLAVEVRTDGAGQSLPEPIQILVFKAARELLTNVVKHAEAGEARVTLDRDDRFLRLSVEDDGRGAQRFADAARMDADGGFGLFSIRSRVACYGGETRVDTGPGQGTRVVLALPLEQMAVGDERDRGGPVIGRGSARSLPDDASAGAAGRDPV